MDSCALKELARAVVNTEAAAVAGLPSRIDVKFVPARRPILDCRGGTAVPGMGRPGRFAGKITATLAVEAVKIMQQYKIQDRPATDDDYRLRGVLNFHDSLQAGEI